MRQVSPKNPFTFCFSMKFKSQKEYDFYNNHPDHVAFEQGKWIPEVAEFMEVAKKNRKNPVVYFWLAAGDQLDLERKLNLGFGYPAVLAVSRTKNVVATMRSSFSVQNTNEFITKVMTGPVLHKCN